MKPWINWKNRQGFSLAEVLVAIGIITVGLLATGALFMLPARMNYTADHRTVAGQVLEEQMNIVRTTYLTSVSTPVQDIQKLQTDWSKSPNNSVSVHNITFNRTLAIQEPLSTSGYEQSLTKVTVTISWSDKNGSHTLSAATLLYSPWH